MRASNKSIAECQVDALERIADALEWFKAYAEKTGPQVRPYETPPGTWTLRGPA